MKTPKNFNEIVDTHSYSTQIVVGGKGLYIKRNILESEASNNSTVWITDDHGFDKTPFTDHVLRIAIYWDEFRMVVTRCRKGAGAKGDVVQTYPFIRNDVRSWDAFRLFLANRVTELYNIGKFGNK